MVTFIRKRPLLSMVIGVILTICLGTFLHFTYKLTNKNPFVALFSPVNESTWEHLKLVFYPMSLYYLVKYIIYKRTLIITTGIGSIFISMILVPVFYYSYVAIIGKNLLIVDIIIYIISLVLGFLLQVYFEKNKQRLMSLTLALLLYIIVCISFFYLTFNPLNCFLFTSPSS